MGGEPVSETTVTRLLSRLEPCGLRPRAIAPSYGLAEAVLLVSSGRSPAGPVFRRLPGGEPQACLGAPVDGVTVTIRDGATGASVAAGETGEIWIDGPSCGRVIPPGSDWRRPPDRHAIRTGDIGRLEDGKVFVSGRDADRIILRGRNLFAEEVEDAVRASQVRASDIDGLVAFGAEREGTQVLVVLIERAPRGPGPDIAALNRAVAARLGVKCDRIVQLRRATLPRTSSGKVRRAAARQAFLAGDYDARVLESVR
jgi:acyl-CoA synthetase (AMP-forming)/AMP-acid ligase II